MKRTVIEAVKKKKLVLIGNGPAGFKFCEKFEKYRLGKQFDLIVYGEEHHPAYDRINLTSYFSEKTVEKLLLAPRSWYAQHKITLKTGQRVVAINRTENTITTSSGETESFDKLILATGSAPFVPPLENHALPGVFVYRTIEDLTAIQAYIRDGQKAVVIGGGILGLEAARALHQAGLPTTVLEIAPHLMPRQLDNEGAAVLQRQVERLGLSVQCGRQVYKVLGSEMVEGVECTDGSRIAADIIVISVGIRPRDELARACELEIGSGGGIVVNNYNLTSDENIYAIGECAFSAGKIWGLAAPCFEMAEVVAARLAKIYKVFRGHTLLTKLKVLEVKVLSFGDAQGEQPHIPLIYSDPATGIYKRVNISPDAQYVLGGIMVGEDAGSSALLHMQRNRIRINGEPAALVDHKPGAKAERITDLPDGTVICLCEGVCKGDIVAEIRENNLTRLDEVKKCTNAGTGCESCTSLLEDLLTEMNRPSLQTND